MVARWRCSCLLNLTIIFFSQSFGLDYSELIQPNAIIQITWSYPSREGINYPNVSVTPPVLNHNGWGYILLWEIQVEGREGVTIYRILTLSILRFKLTANSQQLIPLENYSIAITGLYIWYNTTYDMMMKSRVFQNIENLKSDQSIYEIHSITLRRKSEFLLIQSYTSRQEQWLS